jgi:hypothetical protein
VIQWYARAFAEKYAWLRDEHQAQDWWFIFVRQEKGMKMLGQGSNEATAWADALISMKKEAKYRAMK